MKTAAYTVSFQIRNGQRVAQPELIAGVDITLVNGELTVLRPDSSIPLVVLHRVFETRVSALGILFKGIESEGAAGYRYHELWCAYESMAHHVTAGQGSAPKIKFETVDFIVISYKEVEKVLAWFFKVPVVEGFIANMDPESGWANDTVHRLCIEPESKWTSNHARAIDGVRERGYVQWGWELAAILNEAGRAGMLPIGPVLIEVCW